MRKYLAATILGAAIGITVAAFTIADPPSNTTAFTGPLDDEFFKSHGDPFYIENASRVDVQDEVLVTGVSVPLSLESGDDGAWAGLYPHDTDRPAGEPLTTGSVADIPDGDWQWVRFVFDDPVILEAGETYWLSVGTTGDEGTVVRWHKNNTDDRGPHAQWNQQFGDWTIIFNPGGEQPLRGGYRFR